MKGFALFCRQLLALCGWRDLTAADDPKGIDFFEKNIRPVLVRTATSAIRPAQGAEGRAAARYAGRAFAKGARAARRSFPASRTRACSSRPCGTKTAWRCRRRRSCPTASSPTSRSGSRWAHPTRGSRTSRPSAARSTLLEARKFWSFQPPKIVAAAGREERRLAEERHRSLSARGARSEEPRRRSPTPTGRR